MKKGWFSTDFQKSLANANTSSIPLIKSSSLLWMGNQGVRVDWSQFCTLWVAKVTQSFFDQSNTGNKVKPMRFRDIINNNSKIVLFATEIKLTVQRLNGSDVVLFKLHVRYIPSIVGIHDSISNRWMLDSKGVSEFVYSHPQKICSSAGAVSESFVLVEMSASIRRVECMR